MGRATDKKNKFLLKEISAKKKQHSLIDFVCGLWMAKIANQILRTGELAIYFLFYQFNIIYFEKHTGML